MARWIPLEVFKAFYAKESELLSAEAHGAFLEKLNSPDAREICQRNGIDTFDFQRFVASVKTPEGIVFHGWVAQNSVLETTLLQQKIQGAFEDKNGHLKHTLAKAYQVFVSPFLTPILLKGIPTDLEQLSVYFSFLPLMEADTRVTIEHQLYREIQKRLALLQDLDVLRTEQELIQCVKPLCSDAVITSINHLSKASYALKMEYVDVILESLRTPACTVRFANWILKQLERLTLNQEHVRKLNQLRKELAAGELRVKKFETSRSPIHWRRIIVGTFMLVLIGFGIYLWFWEPFNKAEVYSAYDSAKMDDFDEKELKEIDSLIALIELESFLEGQEIDPGIIVPRGQQVTLRKPFKNTLMEQLFSDLNRDATLKENYIIDSCINATDFERYVGVKDLLQKSGAKTVQFRNESEYDVIVYIAEDKTYGTVHSMYVEAGEMVTFKMNVGDALTAITGNELTLFSPPLGSKLDEKPSRAFKIHFCDTDNNYFESINTSLRLGKTTKATIKFMVTGSLGDAYQLIDIHKVATPY